jgi:hypothetical protein
MRIPDFSNFYSSLWTSKSYRGIAALFAAAGWETVEPDDWDYLEVHSSIGYLVIESMSPMLIHGPIADVEINGEGIVTILTRSDAKFSAECYDQDNNLLREWCST